MTYEEREIEMAQARDKRTEKRRRSKDDMQQSRLYDEKLEAQLEWMRNARGDES